MLLLRIQSARCSNWPAKIHALRSIIGPPSHCAPICRCPHSSCRLASSMDRCPKRSAHAERAVTHCVRIAPARATILAIFCGPWAAVMSHRAYERRSGSIRILHGALQLRAWCCVAEARIPKPARISSERLRSSRISGAELALCMAQSGALRAESEIAERRDAYASRLARLSADCGIRRLHRRSHGRHRPHQPFISV